MAPKTPKGGVGDKEGGASSSSDDGKISVLFVCLGNICRSTMGEGVFRHLTLSEGSPYKEFVGRVDSCGTGGYHVRIIPLIMPLFSWLPCDF